MRDIRTARRFLIALALAGASVACSQVAGLDGIEFHDEDGGLGGGGAAPNWCDGTDTVLGAVAANLQPRQWAVLPHNSSLEALSPASDLGGDTDSAVWDPVRRTVRWVGGGEVNYMLLVYDVATDSWSFEDTGIPDTKYTHDANALDPLTGRHYVARSGNGRIASGIGSSWTEILDIPFAPIVAPAITWFPELATGPGELVYVGGSGDLAAFDGTKWTEIPGATAALWGGYNVFAEYSPVHRIVWLGSGVDGEEVHHRLDAQATLTRLTDAPISLEQGRALHAADPVSGNFLVHHIAESAWWEFDPMADLWTPIDDMVDAPELLGGFFQVPIPECGVIFVLRDHFSGRHAYLYRH